MHTINKKTMDILNDLHATLQSVETLYKKIEYPDEALCGLIEEIRDYQSSKAEKRKGEKLFTKSLYKNEKVHVCKTPTCQKQFESFISLIRHCKKKHPDQGKVTMKQLRVRDYILCLLADVRNKKVKCHKRLEKYRISRHVQIDHKCKKPPKNQFHGFESSDDGETWKVEWKKYSKKSIKDVEVGLEQPLKPEIQHHIHNKVLNKWVKTEDLNNPEVKFKVSLDEQACETFGINIKVKTTKKSNKRTNRKNKDHIGMADSGAACCMGDPGFLKSVGLSIKDLPPCAMRLEAATGFPIKLLGVIPMVIKHGKSETRQFVYITKEKSDFLLPFQALCDLGILSKIGQQS